MVAEYEVNDFALHNKEMLDHLPAGNPSKLLRANNSLT